MAGRGYIEIRCPACKKQLRNDWNYCPKCGKEIKKEAKEK